MATTSLSIKYRPIKIGFLVRDGNIEDLVKAAHNFLGFFDLLLKVDRRVNPKKYKSKNKVI